jgi:hypothetical protein
MGGMEERKLVYMALLIACGVIALSAGPTAGIWSFVQVGLMIELSFWLGTHGAGGVRKRL